MIGDGATTSVPRTEHTYTQNEPVRTPVRVTWTGTFSIGGSPEVFPIRAPIYLQGPPTDLTVVEARAELIGG